MGFCCCGKKSGYIDKQDYFGPNSARKCKDVFWLILFAIFWVGMFVVAILGFANGEIKHYYYGTDMYGNMCGDVNSQRTYVPAEVRTDYSEAKFVYYPDVFNLSINFCVDECPTLDNVGDKKTFMNKEEYYLYPSTGVLNRCLPDLTVFENSTIFNMTIGMMASGTNSSSIDSAILDVLTMDSWLTRVVSDIGELWWLILICIAISFVVGIVWLVLVRLFVGAVTWVMLGLCFVALIVLTIYVWTVTDTLNAESGNLVYEFVDAETLRYVLRVVSVVLLVITIIYFFLVIFLRKRVKLAIAVIKEASNSLRKTPCIPVFPIFQFLIYLVFMIYWVVVLLFLASSYKREPVITNINILGYEPAVPVMYMTLYHLFGGLWMLFWLSGIGQTTIAGAVADRYWSKSDERSTLTVAASLHRTLRYSSGSIALGALLMATIKFIRIIFEYISRVKARAAKKKIRWLSCLLRIVSCCIWCFEKVIKWITESAYIMIAIAGKSFCKSAVQAMSLQAANFLRILVLKGIAFFTLNITRLAISLICSLIATIVAYNYSKLEDVISSVYTPSTLHFWYVPVFLVFIGTWVVSGIFTNVYHISIDTVMMSFCEDESEDGVAVNQKFASLMKKGKKEGDKKEGGDKEDKKADSGKEEKPKKKKSSSGGSKKPASSGKGRDEIITN